MWGLGALDSGFKALADKPRVWGGSDFGFKLRSMLLVWLRVPSWDYCPHDLPTNLILKPLTSNVTPLRNRHETVYGPSEN